MEACAAREMLLQADDLESICSRKPAALLRGVVPALRLVSQSLHRRRYELLDQVQAEKEEYNAHWLHDESEAGHNDDGSAEAHKRTTKNAGGPNEEQE